MKPTQLYFLNPGEKFQVPSCSATLKNGRVVNVTECSAQVTIDQLSNDSWRRVNEYFSTSLLVIKDNWSEKVIDKEKKKGDNTDNTRYKIMNEQNTGLTPKRRGRAPKDTSNYILPTTSEFTVADIAAVNPTLKNSEIQSFVTKITGTKIEAVGTQKGGRGKPKRVFKLI